MWAATLAVALLESCSRYEELAAESALPEGPCALPIPEYLGVAASSCALPGFPTGATQTLRSF